MKILIFSKPGRFFCRAFLFFSLALPARADFKEKHWDPFFERAIDSDSRKIVLAGVLTTALLANQDQAARSQHRDNRTLNSASADWGDAFGEFLVGPAIAAGQLYWDRNNGESHARALAYTAILTHGLKNTVRRERPYGGNFQSFPSGHTSSAFATATSLTYAYGVRAGVVSYPIATFVAFSRISDDVHWLSDTVAGAFIGIWIGRAAFYQPPGEKSTLVWTPEISSRAVGARFYFDF